jgi:GDP-4-dehydro-6-deoxy-D-mannose reductase
LDLSDGPAVVSALRAFRPDLIIHSAAALRDDPLHELVASNIVSLANLLEGAAACDEPPRIVNVSSGSVYGPAGTDQLPLDETAICRPTDLYAATKRAGEDVARIVSAHRGLRIVHARVFNLVGPGLQDRHLSASLAGQAAGIALGLVEPVITVGPLQTTRDFIDVRDTANLVLDLGERGDDGTAYNVASGVEVPTQRIFDLLVRAGGIADRVQIRSQPGRSGEVERSYADITRLSDLGLSTRHGLENSLTDMFDYYVQYVSSVGAG